MLVKKLPANNIVQKVFSAINDATVASEIIDFIELEPAEFHEFINSEHVNQPIVKWYGGSDRPVFTLGSTTMINGVHVPSSCYYLGVHIIRKAV